MSTDAVKTGTAPREHDSSTLGLDASPVVAGGAAIALAKVLAGPLALPVFSLLLLGAGFAVAAALFAGGLAHRQASQDRVDHSRSMRIPRLRRRTLERRPRGFGPVRADASVRHASAAN